MRFLRPTVFFSSSFWTPCPQTFKLHSCLRVGERQHARQRIHLQFVGCDQCVTKETGIFFLFNDAVSCCGCVVSMIVEWSKAKVNVISQQGEVTQGVPGRLWPRIFLTLGTTRVVGHQSYAPAAFTPWEIPGTHFQGLNRPQGTWFRLGEPRKLNEVQCLIIDGIGCAQVFQKSREHLKIVRNGMVTWRKLESGDSQTVRATEQNVVATATWHPGFVQPWVKRYLEHSWTKL